MSLHISEFVHIVETVESSTLKSKKIEILEGPDVPKVRGINIQTLPRKGGRVQIENHYNGKPMRGKEISE